MEIEEIKEFLGKGEILVETETLGRRKEDSGGVKCFCQKGRFLFCTGKVIYHNKSNLQSKRNLNPGGRLRFVVPSSDEKIPLYTVTDW